MLVRMRQREEEKAEKLTEKAGEKLADKAGEKGAGPRESVRPSSDAK